MEETIPAKTSDEDIRGSKLAEGLSDKLELDAFIAKFVENVQANGFKYTMAAGDWKKLLNGAGDGDCGTLSRAAKAICDEFYGEGTATVQRKREAYLVYGGGEVIDGQTANVDGEHWRFGEHYWITAGGKDYDILFCGREVNQDNWHDEDTDFVWTDEYMDYATCEKFGEYMVYLSDPTGPLSHRYTMDPAQAMSDEEYAALAKRAREQAEAEAERKYKEQLKNKCCTLF